MCPFCTIFWKLKNPRYKSQLEASCFSSQREDVSGPDRAAPAPGSADLLPGSLVTPCHAGLPPHSFSLCFSSSRGAPEHSREAAAVQESSLGPRFLIWQVSRSSHRTWMGPSYSRDPWWYPACCLLRLVGWGQGARKSRSDKDVRREISWGQLKGSHFLRRSAGKAKLQTCYMRRHDKPWNIC